MRPLKALIAAASLACAALVMPVVAHAQTGSVIVIDAERLLAESTAGRDMQQRLQTIQQQIQAELTPEQTWAQGEEQALSTATRGQSPEQIRANTQLSQRIETFSTRLQALQQRQQIAQRDFNYTRGQAIGEFNRVAAPVVSEVMRSRNAAVVIDRSIVSTAADNVDATADVMRLLNERVRTINVTRQSPPQQPAQQSGGNTRR